jgi:hypothetical protein
VTRLVVQLRGEAAPREFDMNTSIALARSFAMELQSAAAAAATTAAAADPPATAPAVAATASRRPPIKLTARVQAGRALRDELQRINRLQGKGKSKDATAALAALDASAPSSEQARKCEDELARQRVRELRGELFSYGEVSLTREVLRRFLETPEVRLLLPPQLQVRQQSLRAYFPRIAHGLTTDCPLIAPSLTARRSDSAPMLIRKRRSCCYRPRSTSSLLSIRFAVAVCTVAVGAQTSHATRWALASHSCCRVASSRTAAVLLPAAFSASRTARPSAARSSTVRHSTLAAGGR